MPTSTMGTIYYGIEEMDLVSQDVMRGRDEKVGSRSKLYPLVLAIQFWGRNM